MADEGDRRLRIVSRENGLHMGNDPRLSIDRALPTLKTLVWMGKEPFRRLLEFRRRQEARGAAVVFMHGFDDFNRRAARRRQEFGSFDRLALAAGNDQT